MSINVKVYLLCSSFNVEGEVEDPRRPMSTLQRRSGMESQVQQIQITNTGPQMVSNFGIGLILSTLLVCYNKQHTLNIVPQNKLTYILIFHTIPCIHRTVVDRLISGCVCIYTLIKINKSREQ